MKELAEIKLKPMQEVQNINVEPADNGGCVLRFTIYTPHSKHSDSQWDNHTELFDEDEVEAALDRIRDIYKANLETKKKPKEGMGEEVKASSY